MIVKNLNCVTNVTRYKIKIQKKYFSEFQGTQTQLHLLLISDPKFIVAYRIVGTIRDPSIQNAFLEMGELIRSYGLTKICGDPLLSVKFEKYYEEMRLYKEKDLHINDKFIGFVNNLNLSNR